MITLHVFFNQILIFLISEVVIIFNYVGALDQLEGINFVLYKLADYPVGLLKSIKKRALDSQVLLRVDVLPKINF